MVWPYNEILLSNKKGWTIDWSNNRDKSQMHYSTWKKPDPKGDIVYDANLYEILEKTKL